MNKIAATIMVGVIGVFGIAGCANDSKNEGPKVIVSPTPTTNDTDVRKAQLCLEAAGEISTGLEAISEGVSLLPYVSDAEAREFLATSREFVEVSIDTVQECAEYAPVEAAQLIAALNDLDDALAVAETLY